MYYMGIFRIKYEFHFFFIRVWMTLTHIINERNKHGSTKISGVQRQPCCFACQMLGTEKLKTKYLVQRQETTHNKQPPQIQHSHIGSKHFFGAAEIR